MRRPRITTRGVMLAVAIVAFNCFLVVVFDLGGVILLGLAMNLGLLGLRGGPSRRRCCPTCSGTAG